MMSNECITHGQTCSFEYISWIGMFQRCNNPNDRGYSNYGGRGIKVCDRWFQSFENFLADMGKKPTPSHTIDRIDNDGNYTPENCRWATMQEQCRNRRNNRRITFQGKTLCIIEWLKLQG